MELIEKASMYTLKDGLFTDKSSEHALMSKPNCYYNYVLNIIVRNAVTIIVFDKS